MGRLFSCSWRKSAMLLAVSLVLTGLGFAVRYAEDNQIGETNEVSWWVFVTAGVVAYWAVLGLSVSAFRSLSGRRSSRSAAPQGLR